MPSYDVLVYGDLKTNKSYEVGELSPSSGKASTSSPLPRRCTPAGRRPSWWRTRGGAWMCSSVVSGCRSSVVASVALAPSRFGFFHSTVQSTPTMRSNEIQPQTLLGPSGRRTRSGQLRLLKNGAEAHEFTRDDRAKGGRARAEKIRKRKELRDRFEVSSSKTSPRPSSNSSIGARPGQRLANTSRLAVESARS
jgi:hypothetical protein